MSGYGIGILYGLNKVLLRKTVRKVSPQRIEWKYF